MISWDWPHIGNQLSFCLGDQGERFDKELNNYLSWSSSSIRQPNLFWNKFCIKPYVNTKSYQTICTSNHMYITQRTPEGFELVIVNSILPGLRTRNHIWNVAFILRQKAPTMNKVYMKKILILQVVSIVENQINPNPKFHVLYLKKSYGMSLNIYQKTVNKKLVR